MNCHRAEWGPAGGPTSYVRFRAALTRGCVVCKNICAQEYTAETYAWTMTMESRSAGEIVLLHLPPPSVCASSFFWLVVKNTRQEVRDLAGLMSALPENPRLLTFFRPKSHRGALSPAGGTLLPSGKSQRPVGGVIRTIYGEKLNNYSGPRRKVPGTTDFPGTRTSEN